jgi:hypothetical protein
MHRVALTGLTEVLRNGARALLTQAVKFVVWLFRAECAAANAPIAEATLREIPKSDLPVQARAVSRLGGHVLFFGDCRTTGKGGGYSARLSS